MADPGRGVEGALVAAPWRRHRATRDGVGLTTVPPGAGALPATSDRVTTMLELPGEEAMRGADIGRRNRVSRARTRPTATGPADESGAIDAFYHVYAVNMRETRSPGPVVILQGDARALHGTPHGPDRTRPRRRMWARHLPCSSGIRSWSRGCPRSEGLRPMPELRPLLESPLREGPATAALTSARSFRARDVRVSSASGAPAIHHSVHLPRIPGTGRRPLTATRERYDVRVRRGSGCRCGANAMRSWVRRQVPK